LVYQGERRDLLVPVTEIPSNRSQRYGHHEGLAERRIWGRKRRKNLIRMGKKEEGNNETPLMYSDRLGDASL
jgi:hypothetical protein